MHLNQESRFSFNNSQNLFFFKDRNFIKATLATPVCLRRNCQLFLILTLWSYSKCKDLLDTLNVYKIPAKEQKVVDCGAADELSVF